MFLSLPSHTVPPRLHSSTRLPLCSSWGAGAISTCPVCLGLITVRFKSGQRFYSQPWPSPVGHRLQRDGFPSDICCKAISVRRNICCARAWKWPCSLELLLPSWEPGSHTSFQLHVQLFYKAGQLLRARLMRMREKQPCPEAAASSHSSDWAKPRGCGCLDVDAVWPWCCRPRPGASLILGSFS